MIRLALRNSPDVQQSPGEGICDVEVPLGQALGRNLRPLRVHVLPQRAEREHRVVRLAPGGVGGGQRARGQPLQEVGRQGGVGHDLEGRFRSYFLRIFILFALTS